MADTLKVETTGDFMAQDPTNGQVIEAYGATEVENTAFVQAQIAAGRLKKSSAKNAKEADMPASEAAVPLNPSVNEEDGAAAVASGAIKDADEGKSANKRASKNR